MDLTVLPLSRTMENFKSNIQGAIEMQTFIFNSRGLTKVLFLVFRVYSNWYT